MKVGRKFVIRFATVATVGLIATAGLETLTATAASADNILVTLPQSPCTGSIIIHLHDASTPLTSTIDCSGLGGTWGYLPLGYLPVFVPTPRRPVS